MKPIPLAPSQLAIKSKFRAHLKNLQVFENKAFLKLLRQGYGVRPTA
jgi:hypothetical protein